MRSFIRFVLPFMFVTSGVAAAAAALPAQAGPGTYVVADTWQSLDLPPAPDAWRQPAGVAIGPGGRFYVSDSEAARIAVLDSDGSARNLEITPLEAGPSAPRHLAIDAARGRLYVADGGANAVAVFGLDGTALDSWTGVPGPAGLAVAPDGSVVVAAADTGEIHRYNPAGVLLDSWTVVAGWGGGLLEGVDVDADGSVVVVDGSRRRAQVYDAGGRHLDEVRIPEEAVDVAVEYDPSISDRKRYWFAATSGVLRYDPRYGLWDDCPLSPLSAIAVAAQDGALVAVPATRDTPPRVVLLSCNALTGPPISSWGKSVEEPGTLSGPTDIEIGADGRALILDLGARVQRYQLDGRPVDQVVYAGPVAADAGEDGTLYVTDGSRVVAFDPDGETLWDHVLDQRGEVDAAGLAYDVASGEIVILDAAAPELLRYTTGGRKGRSVPLDGSGTSTVWTDLSADADGNLFVLDRRAPAVAAIALDGRQRTIPLPVRARRLAAGPNGALFTLGRDGWARRYDALGNRTAAFDATRFDVAVSSDPSDLAVGVGGDVFVTDRAANLVSRFSWDAAAESREPPVDGASCRSFPNKIAAPREIMLGELVEVRLMLRGGCGSDVSTVPLDVLLILDRSGSMARDKMRLAREAAIGFVAEVDLGVAQVGVISFNRTARLNSPLTTDQGRLSRAIRAITAQGGTSIDRGLALARDELEMRGRPEAQHVFVLLSDGYNNAGHDPVLREADAAKLDGVEIFTIGIQADEELMRQVATDDEHYFAPESARFLYEIFDTVAKRISTSTLFSTILVSDEVPVNMRYVPDSADPPATFDGRVLRWWLSTVPFNGFGLRYELEPLDVGYWPTNVTAWGDYTDGFGNDGRVDFPVPKVRVRGTVATPTHTPTATPTATPTPTPTATSTPTPQPALVYLPLALRERCDPGRQRVDVVLVIDASTSMRWHTAAGRPKIDAALEAARAFLDQLDLPHDQAAIISFNRNAVLLQQLTGDRIDLVASIGRIQVARQTRIDLGVEMARLELASPRRRAGNQPVMIVLTDGKANPVPADVAVEKARVAKARGVKVFTIGLGDDLDLAALEAMASRPRFFYRTPDAEDLQAIYREIARVIPCAADGFWGRRW